MGRKKRSRGIVWDDDPNSSSPSGRSTLEVDMTSRTSRRKRARSLIDERRNLLSECATLTPERRDQAATLARASLAERGLDAEVLSEGLLTQLAELAEMKKSGARQRLIKHLSATLDEDEWEALTSLLSADRGDEELAT